MPLTMHLDRAGCSEPRFRWVSSIGEALSVLRDQSFDCILVHDVPAAVESGPRFERLSFVRGVRGVGHVEPVLLVAFEIADREWSELCEADCDVLVTTQGWNSTALVPMLGRLVARLRMQQENHRLEVAEHRRLVRDRDEAEQLLKHQRQILGELESLTGPREAKTSAADEITAGNLAAAFVESTSQRARQLRSIDDSYQELLRAYVMMGSQNLAPETARMAECIAVAGLSPRDVLHLHLERVAALVDGLGNRSARHVLARADLLALELMVQISEGVPRPRTAAKTPQRRVSCEGGIDLTTLPPQ